jgi:hypothetical protein
MPDGKFYHKTCVHHHDDTFHVERLPEKRSLLTKKSTSVLLPPCPYPSLLSLKDVATESPQHYYSDWSVYAQTATTTSFNFMTSTWQVPPIPTNHGPFDLSSVYLFNGLEDGAGHHGNATLILQPVLQYGKSGCLINPTKWTSWQAGSYLVDGNGRAHCGKTFPVSVNDTVVGTMTKQSGNSNTWTVTTSGGPNNATSTYTSSLGNKIINAAYLTLEGMVIYNCQTYPSGGGVSFTNIELKNDQGEQIKGTVWTPEIRHDECGQSVAVVSSDQVELEWKNSL